jgi:hypothetical protein
MSEIKRQFRCIYCEKTFTRESWFKRHMCDKKKQFAQANNLDQIKAHRLYNHWMRRNGFCKKGKEKSMEEFQRSPYARPFIDLALFSDKTYVVTAFKYLNFLIDYKIPERDWCKESTAETYRENLTLSDDPLVQARNSYFAIRDWCDQKDIPINHFFSEVGVGDALTMITGLRISPWVIFGYAKAMNELIERFNNSQFFILDEHVGMEYWLRQIETRTEDRTKVAEFCEEHFG